MRLIGQRDVIDLLPMEECIELMAETLAAASSGNAVTPLRTIFPLPSGAGALGVMPAWLGPSDTLGVKVLTVFPKNAGTRLDSHIGAILLFSTENGQLEAIVDASSITAIRTAAVSGLATRLLSRPESSTLALLGSGVQAASHLEAMAAVRPIRQVRIWSRNFERADAFAERHGEEFAGKIVASTSPEEAVAGADLICLTTASPTPIIDSEWIKPGAHINAVGAHTAKTREVDSDTVARAKIVVDSTESALNEGGDLLIPLSEGRISKEAFSVELGKLVRSGESVRTSSDDITLFKSLGLAVEDLAAADYVLRQARTSSKGMGYELGGRRLD